MAPTTRLTFDPKREDFSPYGFTCDQWQPNAMARADRHNEIELNLLPDSTLTYLIGGRRETVPPGRLALFWAATPHQIVEFSTRRPYYVATIPLAWFLGWKLPQQFAELVLAGALVCAADDTRGVDDARLFAQWTRDFVERAPDALRAVALEMEARLRRLALAGGGRPQERLSGLTGRGREEMTKLEQMAAWIAQHYTGPLALRDLGRAVGLHPNYAAGLFRKAFGTTVNASVVSYRVAHAQRLLVVSDRKILNIALESGFNSLSRFNVAFRRACGCTPREYRRKHWMGNVGVAGSEGFAMLGE
jgi:AraC-like DNA-binding protein